MNKKTFDLVIVLSIVLLVCLTIFMFVQVKLMKSDGGKCLRDPLGYVEEQTKGSCSCFVMNNGRMINYFSNNKSLSINENQNNQNIKLNISFEKS